MVTPLQQIVLGCFHAHEEWAVEEFRQLLAEAEEKTPEEARSTIRIVFEHDDYDGPDALKIVRPETDAERHARETRWAENEARRRTFAEERERQEFERLRAKFEGGRQ